MPLLTQPSRHPRWQKLVQAIAATPPASWLFARVATSVDRLFLRFSGGRETLTTLITGLHVVTLTTRGARSGLPRSTPVIPLPDGERLVLVASNFGQGSHPGWYYNLLANPDAMITYRGKTAAYNARQAPPEEAEAYWRRASGLYPGYADYRRRASSGKSPREIAIFVLEPVERVMDSESG